MISKKTLKYAAVLIIIILSISIYGCKGIFSRNIQEEELTKEQNISEEDSQADVDSETKLKAFETAHVYVEQNNPGATFGSGYSEDKVIVESEDLFKVAVDFSIEGNQYSWEILLEYDKQSDSFTILEAPDTEGKVAQESSYEESPQEKPKEQSEEPNETQAGDKQPQDQATQQTPSEQEIKKRAFHTAQADAETMYTDVIFDTEYDDTKIKETSENKFEAVIEFEGLGQGATAKDHFTFKYQLQYDKEKDTSNILAKEFVSSYPVKKTLTEDEIKKGVFAAAQADVLKSYPNAVLSQGYSDKLIEALGNNYYQCLVYINPPQDLWLLYLVRYDPNEGKWFTPFKTDWNKLPERSANSVKHYIETQDGGVKSNCNGVILGSVLGWHKIKGIYTIHIKFQCLKKDGSLKECDWYVSTRYDIFSDSFVEFSTSGNIL